MASILVVQARVIEGENEADCVYKAQKIADPGMRTWMTDCGQALLDELCYGMLSLGGIEVKPLPRQSQVGLFEPIVHPTVERE